MLAHFGNCGIRTSLADNLNLTGTARHNLVMRHKMRLATLTDENTAVLRSKMPAAMRELWGHFNHTELQHINQMAVDVGMPQSNLPFQMVETLPKNNGERFFSEHLAWRKATEPKFDECGRCMCSICLQTNSVNNNAQEKQRPQPTAVPTTTTTTTPTAPPPPITTTTAQSGQRTDTHIANTNNSSDTPRLTRGQLRQQNNVVRVDLQGLQGYNPVGRTAPHCRDTSPDILADIRNTNDNATCAAATMDVSSNVICCACRRIVLLW